MTTSSPIRFAAIFSALAIMASLLPTYFYVKLSYEVESAKLAFELSSQANRIVTEMDKFDPKNDGIFYFPRYKTYQAGLYKKNGQAIFTTIDSRPIVPQAGYSTKDNQGYYALLLPQDIYFGADWLVVTKKADQNELYIRVLAVAFFVFFGVFALSFYLVREFEKPLKRVNERLDSFIKDSVHEINTPLAIIYANVEMLQNKIEQNRYLGRIKAAAKTLSTLCDDMEYLVRQGRTVYQKERIDFGAFLTARIDYFSEIAAMKSLAFETKIQEGVTIEFSRTKLQRIVDNNISNAVKYSYENASIEIGLDRSGDRAVFWVKDYGVGIENPQKIFERYYREDIAKGGFGLGLNIVQQIAHDEEVKIEVVSKPKEGATFRYFF